MYNNNFEGINLVSFKEGKISDSPAKDRYVKVIAKVEQIEIKVMINDVTMLEVTFTTYGLDK